VKTDDTAYAERLVRAQTAWWKRIVDVQWPYRAHLRKLKLGTTLDVGCGIGRNLVALGPASVGVDHNATAIGLARARGLRALTPDEVHSSPYVGPTRFDSLLMAHVAEHMTQRAAVELVREYLPFVKPGGRIVLITPQELGFRSDPTHVEFMDFARLASIAADLELQTVRQYSFPFPRSFGWVFKYNEFVSIVRKRSAGVVDEPR
jgi:SAM-dependent methyltransferase